MGQVAMPYGLYVRKCTGARRNTAGNQHYPVPANVTGAMFYGAPVAFIAGGGVGPVAASPTSAAQTCGVVQGAQWTSVIKPEWFPSLPANTYSAGGRNIEVMVNDDPGLVMMVQATATLDLTAVGKVAALVNWAAGNVSTGRSICALNAATVAATGDLALRIIGVLDPGGLFPDVLVQWNSNVHQLQAMMAGGGTLLEANAVDPEEQQKIFEDFVRDRVDDSREAQGLPPIEEPRRAGETDKQYQDRLAKQREERENRREARRAVNREDRREERQENRAARRDERPAATPVSAGDKGKDK